MALTNTVIEGLDAYGIGAKIRALRTGKGMGLVELGAHTGLSAGLLSRIERGKMYPTLPTLLRVALVFSVGLDHFFTAGAPEVAIVRRGERLRFPGQAKRGVVPYYFESLDFRATERRCSTYLAAFEAIPMDDVPLHRHDGDELLFVLEGTLGLYVRECETVLKAGDSAYFNASVVHGYRRIGRPACRALVVTVP